MWHRLPYNLLPQPFVSGLVGGLDHKVAEGGTNLSVGQRQVLACSALSTALKIYIE